MSKETRVFSIELRADDQSADSRRVVGYAAKFNSKSEDMGFYEIIEPGAFDDVMNDDVRALFNHDPNYILARTKSGTLTLSVDETGLRYAFDVPETTFGNDFLVSLRLGNVSQSSFAFEVAEDEWTQHNTADGKSEWTRKIKKMKRLYDVSPVTYPAYPDTEVALRSMPGYVQEPVVDTENPWAEFMAAATEFHTH